MAQQSMCRKKNNLNYFGEENKLKHSTITSNSNIDLAQVRVALARDNVPAPHWHANHLGPDVDLHGKYICTV